MARRRPRRARRRALGRDDAGDPRRPRLARRRPRRRLLYQLAVSALLLLVAARCGRRTAAVDLSSLAWSIARLPDRSIVSFASYLLWFWLIRHYPGDAGWPRSPC